MVIVERILGISLEFPVVVVLNLQIVSIDLSDVFYMEISWWILCACLPMDMVINIRIGCLSVCLPASASDIVCDTKEPINWILVVYGNSLQSIPLSVHPMLLLNPHVGATFATFCCRGGICGFIVSGGVVEGEDHVMRGIDSWHQFNGKNLLCICLKIRQPVEPPPSGKKNNVKVKLSSLWFLRFVMWLKEMERRNEVVVIWTFNRQPGR